MWKIEYEFSDTTWKTCELIYLSKRLMWVRFSPTQLKNNNMIEKTIFLKNDYQKKLITGILKQLNYLYTIERFSLDARKDIINLNKHLKELQS